MEAPKTRRSIVRKKLCLKSTLKACNYDPVAKVYFRNVSTAPPPKEATLSPKVDGDLDAFKSPTKPASKPIKTVKKRLKMPSKAYSYPIGISCTQDMFAAEWRRAGVGQTEYLSEDEFQDFKDERKRAALLWSKAQYQNKSSSVKTEESSVQELNSSKANSTPLEPTIPDMNGCSMESDGEKGLAASSSKGVTNSDEAGTALPVLHFSSSNNIPTFDYNKKNIDYLRNIKIEKVIIPDSGLSEDEVVCSQMPRSKNLKNSVNNFFSQNELKRSKYLKAEKEISGTTESANNEPELASSSITLKVLPSKQLEVKKANVNTVVLPSIDKLTKEEAQSKNEPSPNLLNAKIHSIPPIKLPLPLSIVRFTKFEWHHVETLSTALKPSQKHFKTSNQTINHFKKHRFSLVRSLFWKVKMLKKKRILHSI